MFGGFRITCMNCGKDGGEIAGAIINGERFIVIGCPHCKRMIGKPADGVIWEELAAKMSS